VRPLAEALALEDHIHTIRRLREMLIQFGAAGRQAVEPLRRSGNPAVRRTAIDLLRVFGGNDALKELAPLLNDADPEVRKDSVRVIVQIGTKEAYAVLERACDASDEQRDLVVNQLITLRDNKAISPLCHVLSTTTPRGPYVALHESILEAFGGLAPHPDATEALKTALHRVEWWAPMRTASLRRVAAVALRRVGSPETLAVLTDAAAHGPRAVRKAARAQLPDAPKEA
jgi:HEAT repeat protein